MTPKTKETPVFKIVLICKIKLDLHTNTWANVLRTTGVIGVKMWFIPTQMNTSEGNLEYMSRWFVNNLPAKSNQPSKLL